MWKKYNIHVARSEAENFLKKKIPKIHCLALKLYTGASKSGGHGGGGSLGPRPPGSASDKYIVVVNLSGVVWFITKLVNGKGIK